MTALGCLLLLVGFLTDNGVVWAFGLCLFAVGTVVYVAELATHRRHRFY